MGAQLDTAPLGEFLAMAVAYIIDTGSLLLLKESPQRYIDSTTPEKYDAPRPDKDKPEIF